MNLIPMGELGMKMRKWEWNIYLLLYPSTFFHISQIILIQITINFIILNVINNNNN